MEPIDDMKEIGDTLLAMATPIYEAFKAAGYGTRPPGFMNYLIAEKCRSHITAYAHHGSGGKQIVLIELFASGRGQFRVSKLIDDPHNTKFNGPPGVEFGPDIPFDSTDPEMPGLLLRLVRQELLAE